MSKLHVGLVVKSFAELCRLVGEEAATGNSRAAQEKRFKRYFDWDKFEGYSLIVTAVYNEQQPGPLRPDDKYGYDILTCLQWDCERKEPEGSCAKLANTYTLAEILFLCGFVSAQWTTRADRIDGAISEYMKSGAPSKSKKQLEKFLGDLDFHIGTYCSTSVDRALDRLLSKGYLRTFRKKRWVRSGKNCRAATPMEEEACEEIESAVREMLGIRRLSIHNRPAFYLKFNERLKQETGLDGAWRVREIVVRRPFEPVSPEKYLEARQRINQNSVAEFFGRAESSVRRGVGEVARSLQNSEDPLLAEIIELLGITPEDVYASSHGSPEEELEVRNALVSWFVELDGAEDYMEKATQALS